MSADAARRPAAFIDRDGVLNARPPDAVRYVLRPDQLRVLPHAAEGLRTLRARGYALVMISNQRGVGTGAMTAADLEAVHERLVAELGRQGATLDRLEHCPHDSTDGCSCRKPRPGMILRARDALGLDLSRSLLIGDDPKDVEAGLAAGVPVRVLMASDGDLRAAVAEALRQVDADPSRRVGRPE